MGKGWLRNLKQAEIGIFLRAICANLGQAWGHVSQFNK